MSQYKPVNYVIFDMDGLLLNTEQIYYKVHEKILSKYGKTYTNTMRVKVMGTVPRETYKIFIEDYNLPLAVDELYAEVMEELLTTMEKAELLPGAERLVSHLVKNNIPIAVATSSGKETFDIKTRRHTEFFSQFRHIVLGSVDPEVKRGKPAPDIFLICASRFCKEATCDQCLVFEDAPNGVQAAVSAGMQVVMVPDSIVPAEKRTLATKVIDSLLEFKPEEFGLPAFENEQ